MPRWCLKALIVRRTFHKLVVVRWHILPMYSLGKPYDGDCAAASCVACVLGEMPNKKL
jgi:hypothetical protein